MHFAHFVNAFKVEVVVKPRPLLVVDSLPHLDTEEHVVHPVVRFTEIVAIICADERQIEFFRQLRHHRICLKFLVDVVILYLNVEISFTHYFHQRF